MSSIRRSVLAVALAAVLTCGTAAGESFTLQQIMSAPFPSDLVASPKGDVAWVFNARGVRNIWMAAPPDYRARPLTRYGEDDGQEITSLEWNRDGRSLLYVRGGSPNSRGEFPNPKLVPEGVEQALWIISREGGEPHRIAQGGSPALRPDTGQVAFVRSAQIWLAALDGSEEPRQLLRTRGRAGSLVWSPDGTRLAFVSARGDHAFVGVYDTGSNRLIYLQPSVDRDAYPAWSPDGGRVAFVRIPATTRRVVFGARRRARPWSIWMADVGSGKGAKIWSAQEGAGSVFRRVSAAAQLFWMAGEQLVFPWERDGWTHLYSVPVSGGEAELLTPGPFEVEHVVLSPDGKTLVYSSNQGDIDRRHLWQVGLDAPPQALTSGRGIEWSPLPLEQGRVALMRSDARGPARPALLAPGGILRDLAPQEIPADFPASLLVEPEQVIFPSADGMKIHGQLFRPRDMREGEQRPAVVFYHGGSRRQMLLGWHYMYYYHNAYAFNQLLASRGYVVLSVNYRSGIGYGMEFREALDYGATGASEYNDVQGAGVYLSARDDVDAGRIGLWGGSYGGYLTAMGLAKSSHLYAAGVDLHGVHDWNLEWERLLPTWDAELEQEARRVAWESSPMAYLHTWRSPVLLIHGDDDRNVVFTQTVQLVEDLRKQGVEVEQLIFPDEVHDFLTHQHWLQAYRASLDFFDRKLGRAGSLSE